MKLEKQVIANALALATAVLWIICSVIVAIFPEFSWQVTMWWMHGMDLSAMGFWNLDLDNFLLGGISLVISAWVTGWILGWSWELMSPKSKRRG